MSRLFKTLIINKQHVRFLPRFQEARRIKLDPEVSNEFLHNPQPEPRADEEECLVITSKKLTNTSSKRVIQSESKKLLLSQSQVESNTTIDENGDLKYTKMQNNDPRILKIMASVKKDPKQRKFILLEGKRLIKEALQRGCHMEYLLFSRMSEVEYLKPYLPKVGKLYKMPYKEMQTWSDLTTTPGIMGVFHIPDTNAYESRSTLPLIIICDNVREPNNLGAILRISSAVGCEKVILTKGCVNLWDSKVLRSACGAHFHTKLCKDAQWDEIAKILPEEANVFLADNNLLTSSRLEESPKELIEIVPALPYFSVDFNKLTKVVLVIGGETEGLSTESYKLAKEYNGARLNIPLSDNVDSLNNSIALGIIAFEIKRRFNK